MKALPRWIVYVIVIAASLVAVILGSEADTSAANPYDPARYGVPPVIAGYEVLTVLTPDNTACMDPEERRLVLQAPQGSVEEFLQQSRPDAVIGALEQLGLTQTAHWFVQYVGPGITLQGFIEENEKWNKDAATGGCIRLGGPIRLPAE